MKRGAKVRIARALGVALTPKAARIMERRPNPPGQHGATMRREVVTIRRSCWKSSGSGAVQHQRPPASERLHRSHQAEREYGGQPLAVVGDAPGWWYAGGVRADNLRRPASGGPRGRAGRRRKSMAQRQCDRVIRCRWPPGAGHDCVHRAAGERAAPRVPPTWTRTAGRQVRELPEREQIPVQAELSLIVEFYSR